MLSSHFFNVLPSALAQRRGQSWTMDHGNGDNKEEEEVVDMMTKTIDNVGDFLRLSLSP